MRATRTLLLLSTGLGLATSLAAADDPDLNYPQARQGDVVDTIAGVEVPDPYRWLENPDDPEVRSWIEAENELTFAYLRDIPQRKQIENRLTELWDYAKYSVPFHKGDRYFWFKNDGLQNQSVLYTADSYDGTPRVLLDPNKLSEDGTVALNGIFTSDNGDLLVYGVSDGGSDWVKFRIRDIRTGNDFPETIEWVKFSGASWTNDNDGFYYSRYDEPAGNELTSANYYQKVYYHKLGTEQSEDRLIYQRKDEKEWGFAANVTEDGDYLILSVWQGTDPRNRVFYKALNRDDAQVVELIPQLEADYSFVGNQGPTFFFYTNLDAPRGRVVAININHPDKADWKEIIPQSRNKLAGVNIVNHQFIAEYLEDAKSQVKIYDLAGKLVRDLDLPGIGSAAGFGGEMDDTETFYSFESFNRPPTIYRLDLVSGQSSIVRKPEIRINPDDYVVEQVFYNSKDGTRVPMFICHKRGIKPTGDNPTLLYGYGGFNISLTPRFSVSNLVWMEMGGVYAQPNLRGGGEYGQEWHDAGRLKNKQNVFDDFITAGEYLIANKWTNPDKLAIAGGSNGGLLVGACLTQRPDLFAAALPAVGVLDMLRFHKFTIGWAWTSDYGSPDDPEMFAILRAYSPYHNIRKGEHYPATLITTGDHDDRVVPAHSFKFAAALQAAQAGHDPVLIRIETRAGHGAGKPTKMLIEELADRYAFLVKTLNMHPNGLN